MKEEHDKLIHLQLVLLSLMQSAQVADPTRELVEQASRDHSVVSLLRERCSTHPIFRSFDRLLNFDTLEPALDEAIRAFAPRAPRYGLFSSGLCLVAGAIAQLGFGSASRCGTCNIDLPLVEANPPKMQAV